MATAERIEQPSDKCDKFKFCIDIEGVQHRWPASTITTEQIAELGGWDPEQGVIQVDEENNETTLEPGAVVELRPGLGFCKKVHWKRG